MDESPTILISGEVVEGVRWANGNPCGRRVESQRELSGEWELLLRKRLLPIPPLLRDAGVRARYRILHNKETSAHINPPDETCYGRILPSHLIRQFLLAIFNAFLRPQYISMLNPALLKLFSTPASEVYQFVELSVIKFQSEGTGASVRIRAHTLNNIIKSVIRWWHS